MSRRRDAAGDADSKEGAEELEAAQQQLEKLRRQHRMRERNRRQYRDEATVILNRQRKILAKLQSEKIALEEQLQVIENKQNARRERSASLSLCNIIERHQQYSEAIEATKQEIGDLNEGIRVAERRLRSEARERPSLRLLQTSRQSAEKSNEALQNRIQQTTVRLNAILADNSVLRTEIQSLLKERDKFVLQADRLEKQISSTSKKKAEMMDQVAKAYTERDEAGGKIRAVRDRVARDDRSYSQELKKLQRVLDHQTQLKSFVTTIAAGEEGQDSRALEEGKEDRGGPMDTLEMYRESMAKLMDAVKGSGVTLMEENGEEEINIENVKSKVADIGEAYYGSNGNEYNVADGILTNFLQLENDNYTIFSYVSNLNNETSGILADITKLKKEIEEIQQKKNADQQKALQTITQLQDKVDAGERAIEEVSLESIRADDVLSKVKETTTDLFRVLRCDPKPVLAITGGGEITSSSVSVFLSAVEQKLTELLLEANGAQGGSNVEDSSMEPSSTGGSPMDNKTALLLLRPSPPHGLAVEDDTSSPKCHSDILDNLYKHMAPQGS